MKYKRSVMYALSVCLAATVFLLIYGVYPLDVTNDIWIIRGYDFTDIIQHYAGWCHFRISQWHFPLGLADTLSLCEGTYITYTDSIPYVAILFKLLNPILPQTFQYFGWFALLCFILQAIAAGLLLERRTKNYILILLGEVFFLTNPVLIERTFKHTALGAQWLVLFSLYLYLEYRNKTRTDRLPWQMILLSFLSVGIHPYFLPMVMIFVLLIVIEALKKRHTIWKTIGYGLLSVAAPLSGGYAIGVIGSGVKNARSGYGYYCMNLNSLFNPQSSGGFLWSYVLKPRGQGQGTFDGFNYLGLGLLILFPITVAIIFLRCCLEKSYRTMCLKSIKKNIWFILCLTFLTCFAISNVLVWDNQVIKEFALPQKLVELCAIFRASGRMFYPVYYTIILVELYSILDLPKKMLSGVMLAGILAVQLLDLRAVFVAKHEEMKTKYYSEGSFLQDEVLNQIEGKSVVVVMEDADADVKKVIAAWAGKKGFSTGFPIANSGVYADSWGYTYQLELDLLAGTAREDVVYITQNAQIQEALENLYEDMGLQKYQRGNTYIYY